MFTANDVDTVKFSKSMNGYKQEEVDAFLDNVADDYRRIDAKIKGLEAEIQKMSKENDDLRISQNSIQNVLISAQKLADQMIGEARQKAEEIIVEAKVRAEELNKSLDEQIASDREKAAENIKRAESEYDAVMAKTAEKSAQMISAATDSVARQQLLFDKLKLDIVNFKSQIMAIYKEHLDSLSKLPDEVPFDSEHAAQVVALRFDEQEALQNIPLSEEADKDVLSVNQETGAEPAEPEKPEEEIKEEKTEDVEGTAQQQEETMSFNNFSGGFVVQNMDNENNASFDDDEDDDEGEDEKPHGFFKRKR